MLKMLRCWLFQQWSPPGRTVRTWMTDQTPDHARLRALLEAYDYATGDEKLAAYHRLSGPLLLAAPALLDEAEANAREIERLRAALKGWKAVEEFRDAMMDDQQ